MESLYVCSFSNGTVKVGRSKNAAMRMRQHADRVGVMGVQLVQWQEFPCETNVAGAEAWLISKCQETASERRANEWFNGLSFAAACLWAQEAVLIPDQRHEGSVTGPHPDFRAIIQALCIAGYRQGDLGRLCGISQSSISDIANGVTADPSYSIGHTLMELLHQEAVMAEARAEQREAA